MVHRWWETIQRYQEQDIMIKMRGTASRVRRSKQEGWGRSTGECLISQIWRAPSTVAVELEMKLSNFPLFPCEILSLFQSEDVIKSENDEADDMPEVQDTVQFIPGSKLLWRINCRPPNSSQVTVAISLCIAIASDLSKGTWVMFKGNLVEVSVLSVHVDRDWQFLLQQ